MLAAARADHVHSHFANSGATVGLLAAHFVQRPWSLTLHGISEMDPPAGSLLREKLLLARFVACASWFMQAQAMRLTAPDVWTKFKIVRCGIDLRALPSRSGDAQSSLAPLRFVTVGRLSPEKGQVGLLRALSQLLQDGLDVNLTIVGDGPMRITIEREIDALGLSKRVVLAGAVEEREALAEIARGDIFILPSLMEGLPVVLMEALALAKPVIAPGVAGIPELVKDGESGMLFKPGDWNELKNCMLRLANDPNLCARLGRNGRERVEAEFEIGIAVTPLVALFRGGAADETSERGDV
jgi:glycosyltransferase involved in cell wall biosynthesis